MWIVLVSQDFSVLYFGSTNRSSPGYDCCSVTLSGEHSNPEERTEEGPLLSSLSPQIPRERQTASSFLKVGACLDILRVVFM